MTVSEAIGTFGGSGCGSFADENGFVLGIDMSEEQNCSAGDFTAVTAGNLGVSAELSPRVVMRDYVDGDKAVPLSAAAKIILRLLAVEGDSVQERIISAAARCLPLRCVYMSGGGTLYSGNMLPQLITVDRGGLYGTEMKIILQPCR